MRKSAFVEWQDPPPKKRPHGRNGPKEFDTPLLTMDLMREPGRWALTAYHHPGNGPQIIKWCERRGIRAEFVTREGRLYVRVLA